MADNFQDMPRTDDGAKNVDAALLDAAINFMPCGFSLWDENLELAMYNQRYLDLYQLPTDKIFRNLPLRDLCQIRIDCGIEKDSNIEASYAQARGEFLAHQDPITPVHVERVIRGRTIRIGVVRQLGVGWIVTHEDITESAERLQTLKVREGELELQNNRFDAAVGNMAHGLAMFDADYKLVICNNAYLDMYHLLQELGKPGTPYQKMLDYRAGLKKSQVISDDGMTPKKAIELARNLKPGQNPIKRTWEFEDGQHVSVMYDSTGDGGWVSTHEDVTEERLRVRAAKFREAELQLQKNRIDAAVSNMAQGLVMFNGEKNLVVCNQVYADIYQLPSKLCVAGTPFADIVACLADNGLLHKDGLEAHNQENLRSLDDDIAHVQDYEMGNGNIISIFHQTMADGGWVSIHADVTEERQRTKALEIREAELRLQNERFAAAVENMAHGLVLFDANNKLVICNQQYAELYGLSDELCVPGTGFDEIVEVCIENGMVREANYGDHAELYDVEKDKPTVFDMKNGKSIAILHRDVSDGGWVSTHEDVTEQQLEVKKIQHQARHDALTNLPNRIYFDEELAKAESRIARGEKMAILCLDLDRFKEINDTLGHGVGDEVLRQTAARLKEAVRDHELVARLGGDEFMLLVGPLEKPQQASCVAERILKDFKNPMLVEGHQVKVGISIGIAVSPLDGTEGVTLVANADRALYRTKKDGRGGFRYFEEGMDQDIRQRQAMEKELKSALDKNELFLTYQPILELGSNRISSCEVLINWEHPELGTLLSSDFVRLAMDIGVNDDLMHWLVEEACKVAVTWPKQVRLAINLSTVQIGHKKLPDIVRVALKKAGLAPDRLELGISEIHILENTTQAVKILHEIRTMGVHICMDEFGRETSSLNHLRMFSFDKINLDASFVADISASQDNREIASAMIGLGQSLGIVMCARGVEEEYQLDFVSELGCHEVQGNLFSPALPVNSVDELLRTVEARAADEAGVISSAKPESGTGG